MLGTRQDSRGVDDGKGLEDLVVHAGHLEPGQEVVAERGQGLERLGLVHDQSVTWLQFENKENKQTLLIKLFGAFWR